MNLYDKDKQKQLSFLQDSYHVIEEQRIFMEKYMKEKGIIKSEDLPQGLQD